MDRTAEAAVRAASISASAGGSNLIYAPQPFLHVSSTDAQKTGNQISLPYDVEWYPILALLIIHYEL